MTPDKKFGRQLLHNHTASVWRLRHSPQHLGGVVHASAVYEITETRCDALTEAILRRKQTLTPLCAVSVVDSVHH